jgi:RNA polymerase sigma factor (sigma-70 family)
MDMDGPTRGQAGLAGETQPGTLPPRAGGGHPIAGARVGEILTGWREQELLLAQGFRECGDLSKQQLEDLYQDLTLALMRRSYQNEKHLQRALRKRLKERALNLHRDEQRRKEILAENAPGIHVLESARSAEASPEQYALLRQDRLLLIELLAELSEKERPVFWLLSEGMKFHRIAKALDVPVNEARKITRSCERKTKQFVALYEAGRLCGYRDATIRALQNGEASSEELALLAFAHLQACAACRAEHKTNAPRLRRAFQGQAAALLPAPTLAAHLGWLARAGLRTRALQQKSLTDSATIAGAGVRERAAAVLTGAGASKLAAGALATAVLAGGAIGASHALEHHSKPRQRPRGASATTGHPARAARPVDLAQPAPAPLTDTREHRIRPSAAHQPSSPGHLVAVSHPTVRHEREIRREPGGFAYLGVPAPPPARRSVPAQTATHTGGPFSP